MAASTEKWSQDSLRASFCHALSEMYKTEVPLYGDLVDLVYQADTETIIAQAKRSSNDLTDVDEILPARHRVERHGAIRLGTAQELTTVRRLFAIMGMHPVGYYDLTLAGFPMHATAFRPTSPEALSRHPFRVFTTVLRMDLLTPRTRLLAERALSQRSIFTDRLQTLIEIAEDRQQPTPFTPEAGQELIAEALKTFRWHSHATVTLDEYQTLKAEHPLIADIVSFPSCHINHLTPRTLNIDAVQSRMWEAGMPAKERIEGPPRRKCPILLRQTSFKAREETVFFRTGHGDYVKGSHTARFGEVEQRGFALTRKGRKLYDEILAAVNTEVAEMEIGTGDAQYESLLERHFQGFPDELGELWAQQLAFFYYHVTPKGSKGLSGLRTASVSQLLREGVLKYEPITYEDFLPLSAGGIFNSNLGNTTQSKRLIMEAEPDLDGFHRMLGVPTTDEFSLYARMQSDSLDQCRVQLGLEEITE